MNELTQVQSFNPFHVQWIDSFFVGREDELRLFEQNLAALGSGNQSHLLVAGVHGTGKSFYLNKLVEIAKREQYIGTVTDCPDSAPLEQAKEMLRTVIKGIQTQIVGSGAIPNANLLNDFESGSHSSFAIPKRTDLMAGDIQSDFETLLARAEAHGYSGIVVCIDEGQRATRVLLSAIKNAISKTKGVLVVLSWRLASDKEGAVNQARKELLERISDTSQDKDIGAAAFFTSATAMGPFKDDHEVIGYFRARLSNNAVAFPPAVSQLLGEISDRVPRAMTLLAHEVYKLAVEQRQTQAKIATVHECFRKLEFRDIKRANEFCAELSVTVQAFIKCLCDSRPPLSATELVQRVYRLTDTNVIQMTAQGVATELDRLCQSEAVIQKIEDKYAIVSSIIRFALKDALGELES